MAGVANNMSRYNKTAIERIRKARDHIYGAVRNLRFGILQQDFSAELKDLDKIFKRLCETWNAETYDWYSPCAKVKEQLREELGREPTSREIQTSLESIDEAQG